MSTTSVSAVACVRGDPPGIFYGEERFCCCVTVTGEHGDCQTETSVEPSGYDEIGFAAGSFDVEYFGGVGACFADKEPARFDQEGCGYPGLVGCNEFRDAFSEYIKVYGNVRLLIGNTDTGTEVDEGKRMSDLLLNADGNPEDVFIVLGNPFPVQFLG